MREREGDGGRERERSVIVNLLVVVYFMINFVLRSIAFIFYYMQGKPFVSCCLGCCSGLLGVFQFCLPLVLLSLCFVLFLFVYFFIVSTEQ